MGGINIIYYRAKIALPTPVAKPAKTVNPSANQTFVMALNSPAHEALLSQYHRLAACASAMASGWMSTYLEGITTLRFVLWLQPRESG